MTGVGLARVLGIAAGLLLLGALEASAACQPCLQGKRTCRKASVAEFKGCKVVCQNTYKGDRTGRAGCVSNCKRQRDAFQGQCLADGRACRDFCGAAEPTCLKDCANSLPGCVRPIDVRRSQGAEACRITARKVRRQCKKGPPPRKPCVQKATQGYSECMDEALSAASTDARDCVAAVSVCVERCAKPEAVAGSGG